MKDHQINLEEMQEYFKGAEFLMASGSGKRLVIKPSIHLMFKIYVDGDLVFLTHSLENAVLRYNNRDWDDPEF